MRVARLLAAAAPPHQRPFLVLADDTGSDSGRIQHAGRITPQFALSEVELANFTHGAETIARAVREETGLQTVFHHHCGSFIETPDDIARLLAHTDPELIGLVFDTGHYLYGTGTNDGAAVMAGLQRFADRIWYVHFKDCDPHIADRARAEGWDYFTAIKHGLFCELGSGAVDFPTIIAWLRQRQYHGFITVEQDLLPGMGTPHASARRNRNYLATLGL
ncbi:MAG: hypothetical protein NVSMB42_17650 [Herpetosiphon sp.]